MKRNENGRPYWRSLDELARTPAFEEAINREFAEEVEAGEFDGTTRRHFLGVMGASLAMTGLSGCVRRPEQKILPYSKAPEHLLPGVPQYYATAANVAGEVVGLVVESHEGRPTKIEGNPQHPGSLGGASASHQGLVLNLYDPARLAALGKEDGSVDYGKLDAFIREHFTAARNNSGVGVSVVSEVIPSPTFHALRDRFLGMFPGAKWYTYEPISEDNQRVGLTAAFGKPVRPVYRLNKAGVVLSLDADFLGGEGASVANAYQWARTRRIAEPGDQMSRLYVVEGQFSLTGSNADHRQRMTAGQVEAFTWALVAEFAKAGRGIPADLAGAAAQGSAALNDAQKAFAAAVAEDLLTRRSGALGGAVVMAGRRQSPTVHALTAHLNRSLGANTQTLYYYRDARRAPEEKGDFESIKALTDELNAGKVETLVIIGGNPVYNAPGDLKFTEALAKAKTKICLADYRSATAAGCDHVIPRLHFLEAWGDLVSADGTVSIQQPLIAPLWGGWSGIELLARMVGAEKPDGYTQVRDYWQRGQRAYVQRNWGGKAFEKVWRKWLHDGRLSAPFFGTLGTSEARPQPLGELATAKPAPLPTKDALELQLVEDAYLHDGRFANNSWLLELPDPMTKLVWDNAVMLSPATAKALGVSSEDKVTLSVDGRTIEGPVWVKPGQADNVVVVNVGFGQDFQQFLPYHEKGTVGFDAYPIRGGARPDLLATVKLAKAGGTYQLVGAQPYDRQEPGYDYPTRPMVREATVEGFNKRPDFAQPGIIEHGKPPPDAIVIQPPPKSLYGDWDYSKGYQWGLAIDLNTCTGCNACMVACVAENNIPMVGKDEVYRGREMFWIRIDRYYTGTAEEPEVVHQPMTCLQCETAPCENVCPVAATAHSPEGLNDMAYNRCIGTRYCLNNCPVKVRRFNFYNFTDDHPETVQMQRNPDVTVRFRGVMEKCTYCVQRINMGKRHARLANDERQSRAAINAIIPACAQTCPTDAITFGDINDPESKVAKLKAQPRNYGVLTELNLQPRTTYLAKVRNPNPKLVG